MCWVFPRGDDVGGHVHGGCKGLRVIVGRDGGQHAGEFRRADQIVFQLQIRIAFLGHEDRLLSGIAWPQERVFHAGGFFRGQEMRGGGLQIPKNVLY